MQSELRDSATGLSFELHPLILLNISDHAMRIAANGLASSSGRVYGVLLGQQKGREISISNSFELQVVESRADSFEINEEFLTKKLDQYKQTFANLDLVGWYTTGGSLDASLMQLHRRVMHMNESAAFLLFDTNLAGKKEIPVYLFESEVHTVNQAPQHVFVKASYKVQTSEAERIAVNQVASALHTEDITKAEQLSSQYSSLSAANQMLVNQIRQLHHVIKSMAKGSIPVDHALLRETASLLRRLPIGSDESFNEAYQSELNEAMLTVLLGNITQGCNDVAELIAKCESTYPKRAI